MKTEFYLVVNSKGSTRTVKTKPGLDWNEVSIKIDLVLPDMLFKKPSLQASINVDDKSVTPFEIDTETINNISTAIEQHTGVPIMLKLVNEKSDS